MLIEFTKMHGLGNDFMVIDLVTQRLELTKDLVQLLGDRHLGIGFDQLLVVEPPMRPDVDFSYRIFNTDGSEVEQCGNGLFRTLFRRVKERQHPFYRQFQQQYDVISGMGISTGRIVLNGWPHGFGSDGGWVKDYAAWLETIFA